MTARLESARAVGFAGPAACQALSTE
jgi:hypothetical protein